MSIHQRHQRHAGAGIVADPGLQVGDVAIARGMHPGLGQRPLRLLQIGLRHLIGRLHRLGIEASLVHRLGRDDAARQAAAPVRLMLGLVEIRFRLGQRRPGIIEGDPVGLGVERKDLLPRLHQLVVLHRYLDDLARHLGGNADQLGAHLAIPGPGPLHVVVPQPPARRQRQRADQQGGEVFEGRER